MNIEKIKKLKTLVRYEGSKPFTLINVIRSELKNYFPDLINYLGDIDLNTRDEMLFEISKYLHYKSFPKGYFLQNIYSSDDKFYFLANGNIGKISIKYIRIYLSFSEFYSYLIKLKLLNQDSLYINCVKKNQKSFPFKIDMDIFSLEEIKKPFYQEEIKKIKDKIQKLKDSFSKTKIINITEFISVYNPDIIQNNFEITENKYPTYLPYYLFNKQIDPPAFIGDLNKPKNIKLLSCYVSLTNCSTFYIDKLELNEDNKIYIHFNQKVGDLVSDEIFKKNYLFKNIDINFLNNQYGKYFKHLILDKGETLMVENRPHEGIYFINNGTFHLKSKRSYNELEDLYFSLLHSMDNFANNYKNFQDKVKQYEKRNQKDKNELEELEVLKKEDHFTSKTNEKNNIFFKKVTNPEIIGLSDLYDFKTGLYNFTAICMSEKADVFFLPNELVTSLISNEKLNLKIAEYISNTSIYLLNEILKKKEEFENIIKKDIERKKLFKDEQSKKNIKKKNSKVTQKLQLIKSNNIEERRKDFLFKRNNSSNKYEILGSNFKFFEKNNKVFFNSNIKVKEKEKNNNTNNNFNVDYYPNKNKEKKLDRLGFSNNNKNRPNIISSFFNDKKENLTIKPTNLFFNTSNIPKDTCIVLTKKKLPLDNLCEYNNNNKFKKRNLMINVNSIPKIRNYSFSNKNYTKIEGVKGKIKDKEINNYKTIDKEDYKVKILKKERKILRSALMHYRIPNPGEKNYIVAETETSNNYNNKMNIIINTLTRNNTPLGNRKNNRNINRFFPSRERNKTCYKNLFFAKINDNNQNKLDYKDPYFEKGGLKYKIFVNKENEYMNKTGLWGLNSLIDGNRNENIILH